MWFFTVKPPLTATSLQLPLLFVLADSLFVDSTKFKPLYNGRIGSLSSDVFEPRTSTGSEVFSLLTCLDDIKFVFLSFFTVIEAIWLKICAKQPSKNEKRPLQVDVRRSKTLLLKLPIVTLLTCFKLANCFFYKGNKGRCKESTIRGHRKIWAPDGIRTHDPPCSRSDALTSELLRTRWRAKVIFVGWTCEPHLAVTQSITSNTLRLNCITQSH